MTPKAISLALLIGAAPAALFAQPPAPPQPRRAQRPATPPRGAACAPAPARARREDTEDIVVTGSRRPPGSAIGDIPPEITLNQGDIRAYEVSSVTDLLSELAPQTGSGQGRGGQAPGRAPERPPNFGAARNPGHSDRGDPAARDPARGGRAALRLHRRPEGGEHRPAALLPRDHRRSFGRHLDRGRRYERQRRGRHAAHPPRHQAQPRRQISGQRSAARKPARYPARCAAPALRLRRQCQRRVRPARRRDRPRA